MVKLFLAGLLVSAIAAGQTESLVAQASRSVIDLALKDKNPDTRRQAIIALSIAGAEEPYLSMLDTALGDRDVEVRLAAIASLVDLKSPRATAALTKALKDDVPEVSFAAARGLWGLNDPEGKQALLAVLGRETKTSSSYFTKQKRDAMRMMHTPRTMFLLAVKEGIGFAPVPGAGAGMASMQALLTDPGVSGRATAALLLGREMDSTTLAALRDALQDRDWSVRAAAVHSLALHNDVSLEPELEKLIDDRKEAVRLRAAAACLRLELLKKGPPPIVSSDDKGDK